MKQPVLTLRPLNIQQSDLSGVKAADEKHVSRTGPALWYTYKGCSPQWALHLRDSQQKEKKEQGRDLLRATEVDRCTTVIQIAFTPVLQSEISPGVERLL